VKRAFDDAYLDVDARHMLQAIDMTTLKRERYNSDGKLFVDVTIDGLPDALTIDLSEVEQSFHLLGIPREAFLRTLATKIRAHRALFNSPGENVILSVGALVHGIFSWNATDGYVRCSNLFRIRGEVDPVHLSEWWRVLFAYNALRSEGYRSVARPADPTEQTRQGQAVNRFLHALGSIEASVDKLANLGFHEVQSCFVLSKINAEHAKESWKLQDFSAANTYLDLAVTALHDIVKAAMPPVDGEL
jgi:hypothetical protein